MNELASRKLGEIVTQYGRSIADDPRRLRALLTDLCPGLTREVHVLVSAVDCGVARELTGSAAGQPWELLHGRLTRRLTEQTAIAEEAARWAVATWGLALGVLQAQPAHKKHAEPPPVPSLSPKPPAGPVLVQPLPDTDRPLRTPPPKPRKAPPPPPDPVQVYPIRQPPRSRRRLAIILPLVCFFVTLGLLTIFFWPFWGRHKPAEGEVTPTSFDTELALLPGDCQFLISMDMPGLTRSMGGVNFEQAAELFNSPSSVREIAEMREQFQAQFGKPVETLQRGTLFGIEGEKKHSPRLALTLTFATPLDAAAVEKSWSQGVHRSGHALLKPREKKLVQQRAYWRQNNGGAYLPTTADWQPPRIENATNAPAADQAARACVFGDHPVVEKMLAPNRTHLTPGSLATLLNRTDFKKALVAAWAGRDALAALKNSMMPPEAERERHRQVTALFEGAEEAVGRLDLRDDRPRLNLIVTYANDTNARQAEETVRALVREFQDEWNKKQKKEMLDSLTSKNDRLRPQFEAFVDSVEKSLSFSVHRDWRTLDVSLRLDRSPATVLTEMASLDRAAQRETDEESRRRLTELTQAAKVYKVRNGSWPPSLDTLLDEKAGLMPRNALQSTWGRWRFHYVAAGLHHRELEPDIWVVTPQGKLLCGWDTAGGDIKNQPAEFVVRLDDLSSAAEKHYALLGSRETMKLDQVREALKQHTRAHPSSTSLRLLLNDKSHAWSQPAWRIRYLAEETGYQIVEQVTGAGAK